MGYLRFFPVSHSLFRDPEFIALRQKHPDWMGYVWLDMLAWADRTGGTLKGDITEICLTLARDVPKMYPRRAAHQIEIALRYMEDVGWIHITSRAIEIVNYAKYHRTRNPISHRPERETVALLTNLTNLTNLKNKEETSSLVQTPKKAPLTRHQKIPLEGAWPSVKSLVEMYNKQTPDECVAVREISEARKEKIRKYLTQFPTVNFWEEVMGQIRASRFLRGLQNQNGHSAFTADLDWLLSKGKDGTENCVKVHDGRYHD